MSHWTPRHARTLLAVPIASLAIMALGCGDSGQGTASSTTPAATTLPATTAPPAPTVTPATTATTATPTTTATTSKPAAGSVATRGPNGRMYHCVGPLLLRDLRTLSRRIDRGRRSLRRIRSELRRLKRRYPSKIAPPRVAQRYNYLVRKHNALLRLGNRGVRAYNQRLERDCTRG